MAAPHPLIRAFQWDVARQVERLDWLLAQLPRYAEWGYQELYLHLEDAVEYPGLPQVARRDAYTYRQLERLVAAATRVGIGVVPIVNLLGHTQYLIKVPELRDLNELRAPDGSPLPQGQICPLHPRTLEVAEKLLRDMAPFCTTGKVHVGLDESFHLGKHPLSRAEVKRIGLPAHFAGHVNRLQQLCRSLGLHMGMWADMFYFLPEAIRLLPPGLIAYDWYYYPFARHPRVEMFNFVERDLATALRRQGIAYWGCPMNGAFRFEPMPIFGDRLANIRSWWERCQRVKAQGMLVTSWEANRLAMETTTVVDAAAACLWNEPHVREPQAMLARGFERVFPGRGRQTAPSATALAQACLEGDAHAFAGYARWEINKHWSLATDAADLSVFRRELRFFERLLSDFPPHSLPEAFKASWQFRRYLAQRDVFVREALRDVQALRRLARRKQPSDVGNILKRLHERAGRFRSQLVTGRAAAQTMWRRSRMAKSASPNLQILARDLEQLRTLAKWIAACRRDPAAAVSQNPICGRWQVHYEVLNFAPAVQAVAVEQLTPDGWTVLKTCHTIEFQAKGAVRRSRLVHTHRANLIWQEAALAVRLRFVVRGTGRVKIGRVFLTDGTESIGVEHGKAGTWLTLGRPAFSGRIPRLNHASVWTVPPATWNAASKM